MPSQFVERSQGRDSRQAMPPQQPHRTRFDNATVRKVYDENGKKYLVRSVQRSIVREQPPNGQRQSRNQGWSARPGASQQQPGPQIHQSAGNRSAERSRNGPGPNPPSNAGPNQPQQQWQSNQPQGWQLSPSRGWQRGQPSQQRQTAPPRPSQQQQAAPRRPRETPEEREKRAKKKARYIKWLMWFVS